MHPTSSRTMRRKLAVRSVATDCIVVCIAAVVLFAAAFIPWITSPALTNWVALPRPGRLGRRSLTVTRSSSTKVENRAVVNGVYLRYV